MKILLTAPPGIGKSTVIEAVVRAFPGTSRGIVAREVLDPQGERVGFTSVNSALQEKQFMFRNPTPGAGQIAGEFDVDVSAIDSFVVPELRAAMHDANALVYVDEIGRAQALSSKFLAVLREIFQSKVNMLAAIVYDDELWSMEFKRDKHACKLEVTAANRNAMPAILQAAFKNADCFAHLTDRQEQLAFEHLQNLIDSKQFVAAAKLFDNAIHYVVENRVALRTTHGNTSEYEITGKTREHKIVYDKTDGRFDCDCDLSNGKGMFAGYPETCSHQLSVLLTQN